MRASQSKKTRGFLPHRAFLTLLLVYLGFAAVIARLFFWQVVKGDELREQTQSQLLRQTQEVGNRGQIFTAEGNLLVGNKTLFHLMAEKGALDDAQKRQLVPLVAQILAKTEDDFQEASESAHRQTYLEEKEGYLKERLALESNWIRLASRISQETKREIEALGFPALYFEDYGARDYPEASMAAHITGFVGKNEEGSDTGYFGIEGALNKELRARNKISRFFANAFGQFLSGEQKVDTTSLDGRDIYLTLRRDVQFLLEDLLEEGITRYGALAGEIVVMEPKTGNILGLASWPKYDQEEYYEFETELYKNPSLANLYEPGSTFKTLTVAAGLDTEAITPETECPNCEGPLQFGKYTIRTWNEEYHPNITMKDALAKSDNIAMIYVARELGQEAFVEYLEKFGIGEEIGLDLQDDSNTPFPERWGETALATASFGQGITANSLQMVRAVGAIANQGNMMQPRIIHRVVDHQTQKEITLDPKTVRQVIKPETASTMTEFMVHAAQYGEAQWIASKTHTIAGKTGTSQIPEAGKYKEDATIASFIGFAPADDPQFVMLVKLVEPQSSPWAAETAAPLWYKVAHRLFLLLNIPPDY